MNEPSNGWEGLQDAVLERSTFTQNIAQQYLTVTRDKVELALVKFQGALKSRTDWHTPAGILATLLATLAAAQFREALGLSPDVWRALFVLATGLCVIWLVVTAARAWLTRSVSVATLIDRLYREGVTRESLDQGAAEQRRVLPESSARS